MDEYLDSNQMRMKQQRNAAANSKNSFSDGDAFFNQPKTGNLRGPKVKQF